MRDVELRTHRPPEPLRDLVALGHGYRVGANPQGLHRGLPSRHLTLVVELAAPLRTTGPSGRLAAHGVVGGLHTEAVLIDATVPQDGLQYALTPHGARALLGVSPAELRDHNVDLRDILGTQADRLVEELKHTASWSERFRMLDAALLRRVDERAPRVAPEVAEAWRVIFHSDGRVPVAAVAAHVGWSRRHLSGRFSSSTGLTPKEAVRVARFEAVRRLLLHPDRPGLADIAARCGYADQPHLAREWRAMAGCSIRTWLREELPFVQDAHDGEPADSAV